MKLVVRDQQGQPSLICPTCRQATSIPATGVAGLQSAFHINRMLEIRDTFKEAKDTGASQEKAEVDMTHPIPSSGKGSSNCPEHAKEELKLFCETCGVLICCECAIRGGKHHNHDFESIYKAFEKCKRELTHSLEPMEEKLASVNKALAQLDKHCGEISDQQAVIEANIHDSIGRLIETLEVRKTELIGKLHRMTQGKLKGLAVQRDQMETIQVQLSSSLELVKGVKTVNQGEVLKMKTNLMKQVEELTTAFQPDMLKPAIEPDMIFLASQDATLMCQNFGKVYAQGSLSPSSCHAKGKGLEDAAVEEISTAIVFAVNYEGGPYTKPLNSLQCELISQITGATVRGSVKRKEKELNLYEISYQPTLKGEHQLDIKVDEQHIRGSPFSVAVKSAPKKLGAPIKIIDGVITPFGVSVNQRGEAVVTEHDRYCVSIFRPSGEKLRSFGTYGSDQGQFERPRGVAVDGDGNILVVDGNNNRIQKFTADGRFLAAVGTKGDGPLQFNDPYGITLNTANNKAYVVEYSNHRVQMLNSDLTFSSTFGRQGSSKGQFNYPYAISCDSTGNVYVADSSNHRIQVFTAKGRFSHTFGRRGQGKGELYYPDGVAVDRNDVVYVSDTYNHRISVFSSKGQFVTAFGGMGMRPGEFNYPFGLAVDNSGVVYVCDFTNNRLQLF